MIKIWITERLSWLAALFSVIFFTAPVALATDQELLDTLFQNGVLNKAQYDNLSTKTAQKEAEEATSQFA